ncbi:MAG TPA: DUF58 domain-containing protein [Edaphocola sp.]|nr:DUF58 domain-containing protein [Edaphocola sp.]
MKISEFQFNIGNLELLARQVVEGFIIGLHKSPFHGFSVEFAEHRLYNPGDNLKYVDWKVFGKRDKMFVKKFEEETNLKCCIAIDTSSSMWLSKQDGVSKMQFSCLAAAALMQLLRKQLDATGLCLFSDKVHFQSLVKSSERHYKTLISEMEKLLIHPPEHKATNLPAVLHQLAETLPKRSFLIVFSDFLDDPEREEEFYTALQHLKFMKQEVIVFQVGDGKQEWDFEFENRPYQFVDLETGEKLKLNPKEVRPYFLEAVNAYNKRLEAHCLQYNIDLTKVDIQLDIYKILENYLIKRNKLM